MNNRQQLKKRFRFGLVLLISPEQDQLILETISQNFPDVTILYRTLANEPLWIQRGRPPMEATRQ